jgi:phytoene dehydrogenase-like protein
VRTGARVAAIRVDHGHAAGVTLESGDDLPARIVVSAVDPKQTFLDLIEPDDLDPSFRERIRRYRARGVTAKINLALGTLPEFPALRGDPVMLRGRLLIAPGLDYLERAHDAAKYGRISSEPWLEVAIPSVIDPSLAPEGAHVMSIYVQCAPRELKDEHWMDQRQRLFRATMDVLAAHAPDLEPSIVARDIITPEDLELDWGLSGGHIFHGELSLDQSWLARPLLGWARYETPIAGLFMVGAGTHPGGGLTGASAWLAVERIQHWLRSAGRER